MKLFVLLFIGIIQFSEEIPTTVPETTTTGSAENETSIVTEFLLTLEPKDEAKTVSSAEKAVKNSSESNEPPKTVQHPVDLLSGDILLDPSLILARAERSVEGSESLELSGPTDDDSLNIDRFQNGIPTFYFLRFVRVPRSVIDLEHKPEKIELLRTPEEPDNIVKRFSRSSGNAETEDLDGADDGFIIRPLFKYRHEQLKRSNRKGYRNRDSYYYYPRYPVFPG